MSQAAAVLNVLVNGERHTLRQAATLAGLMETLTPVPDTMATALNGEFVPRSQRSTTLLRDGDHVTCFQLIAGG